MKNKINVQIVIFYTCIAIISIGLLSYLKMIFPPVSVLYIFTPLIFSYFTRHFGWPSAVGLLALSSALLMLLPTVDWLTLFLIYGPLGISMGLPPVQKLQIVNRIGISTIVTFLGTFLWYNGVSELFFGGDLIGTLIDQMKGLLTEGSLIENLGTLYGSLPEGFESELVNLTLDILPSIITIFLMALVLLNYYMEFWVLYVERPSHSKPESIAIELPQDILNGATVFLVGALIVHLIDEALGAVLLQNIMIVIMFVFSIQGVGLINLMLKENGVFKLGRLLIVAFCIFIMQLLGLGLLGWLDLVFGLRRRFVKR